MNRLSFLAVAGGAAATVPLLGATPRLFVPRTQGVLAATASHATGAFVRSPALKMRLPVRRLNSQLAYDLNRRFGITAIEERGVRYAATTNMIQCADTCGGGGGGGGSDPSWSYSVAYSQDNSWDGFSGFYDGGNDITTYWFGSQMGYYPRFAFYFAAPYYQNNIKRLVSACLADAIKLAAGATAAFQSAQAWWSANPTAAAVWARWLATPVALRGIVATVGFISEMVALIGGVNVILILGGALGLWELYVALNKCMTTTAGG